MSIYSFKQQKSVSNYGSIKDFLESEYGMTNNLYDRDQWDDFYGTNNSKQSNDTPPTVSSLERMTTKYNPKHYQRGSIQVWDFIVDQQLDFLAGNIIKYICRAGYKDQETEIDDWLKIRAYVNRKLEALTDDGNS